MYPPARSTPRASSSAATAAQTNPLRSNNNRNDQSTRKSSAAETTISTQRAIADSESDFSGSQSMDDRSAEQARETQRLNQIVQQFFVKGALIVASSRVNLPTFINRAGGPKVNKWFNILLNDSEELSRQTAKWRTLDVEIGLPKTMTIEIYLDLLELARGKSLVIGDEQGKRWDVMEAFMESNPARLRGISSEPDSTEMPLVLERWQFSMEDISTIDSRPDADALSNVYKKGIPIFRSLYSQTRLLPAYKYHRRFLHQTSSGSGASLKLKYRITEGPLPISRRDPLEYALYPNQRNLIDRFSFGPLQCPAGILHASVTYRINCDFRVDDSEALLSSHFMRTGDDYFRPSWPGRTASDSNQVAGSAPAHKKRISGEDNDGGQVYGSLSTFHTVGPKASSSPISALRAVTDAGSPHSPPMKPPARTVQASSASIRSKDGMPSSPRRPSISFQPFKAGSLSSSPATGMHMPLSPASQSSRAVPTITHRSRPSFTTLPQAILRTPNLQSDTAVASSTSSSPRPAPPITKFSSSFNYRRSRMSSGASRGEDERSSGKPSPSSSARVGSDVLNEGRGDQGSSESVQQTDDEQLQDFLRLLESKKDLPSLSRNDTAARDASMRRTTAALSKYQRMKESNSVLSDSISSSLHLNRSSSSSSRQLANVPQMVPGTSFSPASSVGKPISPHTPHTPHTPAIPSRLSANSIVNYSAPSPRRSRSSGRQHDHSGETTQEEDSSDTATRTDTGTTAIPIPTSPRLWAYGRRSSSARNQRSGEDAEDAQRPYSLPDEREMSLDLGSEEAHPPPDQAEQDEQLEDDRRSSDDPSPAEYPTEAPRHVYSATADPSSHGLFSRRPRGSLGRRSSPAFVHSYSPSSSGQGGGASSTAERSATAERGGTRGTPSLRSSTVQDDEALIFELSDMDSRRSLEDAPERGGFRGGRWGR